MRGTKDAAEDWESNSSVPLKLDYPRSSGILCLVPTFIIMFVELCCEDFPSGSSISSRMSESLFWVVFMRNAVRSSLGVARRVACVDQVRARMKKLGIKD